MILNKEVIKFAAYLSLVRPVLLELIFRRLTAYLKSNFFDEYSLDFLRSLEKELKHKEPLNVFNNKYLSYTTRGNPECYIPSRFYKFDKDVADSNAVRYNITCSDIRNLPDAECALHVPSNALQNSLEILREIQKRIRVVVSSFTVLEDHLFPNYAIGGLAELDENTTKVMKSKTTVIFGIRRLPLSQPAFSYIAQQLRDCVKMDILCLIDVQQNIPVKLGEAVASLSSLKIANLQYCRMTRQSCEALLLGITCCPLLSVLDLSHSILTDCLEYLLGGANNCGFPSLKALFVENTGLSRKDIGTIVTAIRQNKLPYLLCLDLSRNILTGQMEMLLPVRGGAYPDLQRLQALFMKDTFLNSADTKSLSQAVQLNKLPCLTYLDLSYNSLTGCMERLLKQTEGPNLNFLEELSLAGTQLSKTDVKLLAKALTDGRLCNIKRLNQGENKLTGMIGELFIGKGLPSVQSMKLQCTGLGKKDFLLISDAMKCGKLPNLRSIDLIGNNNTQKLEEEVISVCEACFTCYQRYPEISMSLEECDTETVHKEMHSLFPDSRLRTTGIEMIHIAGNLFIEEDILKNNRFKVDSFGSGDNLIGFLVM